MSSQFILLGVMFATLFVLVAGVVLMASGGKLNAKYGNKLMQWRVVLQAIAILILFLIFAKAS